jgi:LysW-gamma-L-lysine carboxypeptidase
MDRRNPVVRALTAGIRRRGGAPALLLKTATSDMNTLAESWDIPMAAYGPGDSKLDHADLEHIVLEEYFAAIQVLSQALEELADLPTGEGPRHERQALATGCPAGVERSPL